MRIINCLLLPHSNLEEGKNNLVKFIFNYLIVFKIRLLKNVFKTISC